MKVVGLIAALVAAAPLASAVPFRMSDILGSVAARGKYLCSWSLISSLIKLHSDLYSRLAPKSAPQQTEDAFPQYRSWNITTRDVNVTDHSARGALIDKRAFIPDGKFTTHARKRRAASHLG